MRKVIAVLGVFPFLLAACETAPNPYPNGPGFYENQIEEGRIRITYRAAPGMSRERAEDFTLLRAADITLGRGYDWFRIVDRSNMVLGPSGPVIGLGGGSSSFGGHSSVGVGLGTSFQLGGPPSQVTTVEILMGKGPKPDERSIYDAADVSQTLRSRL